MDRGYKGVLHRYVAAYIDLNHASLGHPGEKAAVGVIGQFYDAADRLSRKKDEVCGSPDIPDLDQMLNRDEKVSRLALSRIRAAVKRGCAGVEQLEMEEAYSYAVFLTRRRGAIIVRKRRLRLIRRQTYADTFPGITQSLRG